MSKRFKVNRFGWYYEDFPKCNKTNKSLGEPFQQSRAILASTIEIVDEINDYVTNLLPGKTIYLLLSLSIILFFPLNLNQNTQLYR